jgi:DNA replication and repair protein RecF
MHIENIILNNFKNYESLNITLSERLNGFVGLNGMGKTNLLDAIYYLCMCKSHFLASDNDVILRGADFMRLEGHFILNEKREKIVAKMPARKRKTFERNDVAYNTLSEHIGFLPIVIFTPDDTLLAKEGSEERRRFVDNTLSQIDNQYLTHLIFYNKILEQRNALLKKQGKKGSNTEGISARDLENLLAVYDAQMLEPAQYVFEKRQSFIANLTPIFNMYYKDISGERESVVLQYESPLLTYTLQDILTQNREKDLILQRTTGGIHRDDIGFEMDGKPLKKFGSQGQLKTFILSLKLAQYDILRGVKKEVPILLLDDIFDKLDAERLFNFLKVVTNLHHNVEGVEGGQIFITDTQEARLRDMMHNLGLDFKLFKVENGQVVV